MASSEDEPTPATTVCIDSGARPSAAAGDGGLHDEPSTARSKASSAQDEPSKAVSDDAPSKASTGQKPSMNLPCLVTGMCVDVKRQKWLLNLFWGMAISSIIASGFMMAGTIMDSWLHRLEENAWNQEGADKRDDIAPAPDWKLAISGLAGSIVSSVFFGILTYTESGANYVRGALEYTTLMMVALRRGRRFKYAKRQKKVKDENASEKLAREIHQLKVEAGLAGWTSEDVDKQIDLLQQAFDATQDKQARVQATKVETAKMARMLEHTLSAMPLISAIAVVIILLVFFAAAIMAWGLTLGIFHMPDESDDAVWVECLWQIVNFMFTIVAVWKGPQRAKLLYHLCRHDFEAMVDGTARSLLVPGVLLTRRQLFIVAVFRMLNVVCQYMVNFFQWAWFRRCWQEAKEDYRICTVRPGWGILAFLVPAICFDNLSQMMMHRYITQCEYCMWPTSEDFGLDPGTATAQLKLHGEDTTSGAPILIHCAEAENLAENELVMGKGLSDHNAL